MKTTGLGTKPNRGAAQAPRTWALIMLLFALPVLDAAAAKATAELSPERQQRMIRQAIKAIGDGKSEEAITKYLDPVIAQYERLRVDDGPRYFSANSMTESLIYAALGAAADEDERSSRGTTVVGGGWGTALQVKGYALTELGRYDEAKATLQDGVALAPMNPALWNELGAIHQEQKNWTAALEAYTEAETGAEIVFDDESQEVNLMLTRALRGQGFIHIERGDLDEAESLYKRVLELDPKDERAKHQLRYLQELRESKRRADGAIDTRGETTN